MKVHRMLTSAEDRLSRMDAEGGGGDELVPPFRFVGMEPPQGGQGAVERFVDGTGTPCNVLQIWRADRDPDCPSVALGYLAHCTRQVEAAGYRRVSDGTGSWHWGRAATATR
jgi:hypothetical protein